MLFLERNQFSYKKVFWKPDIHNLPVIMEPLPRLFFVADIFIGYPLNKISFQNVATESIWAKFSSVLILLDWVYLIWFTW